MKIVIAPDSLKESLTAPEAAAAMARGVRRAAPECRVVEMPVADGGEGTTDALVEATGGVHRRAEVADPLGRPVEATWGMCGDGRTAVIEMAQASGLERLDPGERDPMKTTTRGTGQLIRCALDAGAERIIVGIGGSATVDGGTGMAHALGLQFRDENGHRITDPCGGRLEEIQEIEASERDPRLGSVELVVACDVTNPLTGPDGAAAVYAPQKGATPRQVERLAAGLEHLAGVIRRCLGRDVEDVPGAGAAGGLGAGLVAFAGARLQSGVETVIQAVGLREEVEGADLVLTAEGRLDRQSAFGKATAGVVSVASRAGKPVVALCGQLGDGYRELFESGLCAAFALPDRPMSLQTALGQAERLLEQSAESVVRLWLARREADG